MSKARKTREISEERLAAPLSRNLRVDEIKPGETYVFDANAAERAAIAELLDLVALDRLSFACSFERRGEGRLLMRGTLQALVTQTCVVTLEPLASTIEAPIELEFWPAPPIEDLAATADEAASHGMLDWPEPISDGKVELGPVIYETLATALNPYPRAEGATFEWSEAPEGGEARPESPFAALAQLKKP